MQPPFCLAHRRKFMSYLLGEWVQLAGNLDKRRLLFAKPIISLNINAKIQEVKEMGRIVMAWTKILSVNSLHFLWIAEAVGITGNPWLVVTAMDSALSWEAGIFCAISKHLYRIKWYK